MSLTADPWAAAANLWDQADNRPTWRTIARPDQLPPAGDWDTWLLLAGRGFGKRLDVNTPIPTPSGWAKLGDMAVGDELFDESGRPCRILRVFDGLPDVAYRVTFSDGTTLDADAEHQWVTWTHAERKAYLRSPYEPERGRFPAEWPTWRLARARDRGEPCGPQIRTTEQIARTQTIGARGDRNHCIPTAGALRLPDADLPIDPYVLGAWLGDGASAGGSFTCHEDDQPHLYAELHRAGYDPRPWSHPQQVGARGLFRPLRLAGLIGAKHVPAAYFRASADQRAALLQGLMDTDGSTSGGHVEFTSTRRVLADAVVELARSLGQKPVIAEGRATIDGRDCGPKWRVTWRPTVDVFRLPRKRDAVRDAGAQSLRNHHRMVVSVERIDLTPMRCLTVDSPHSMFLAGDGMVPTHNTRTMMEDAAENGRRFPGARIALIGATIADGRDVLVEGESGLLACFTDDELRGGSIDTAWNRSLGELFLANGTKYKVYSSERPRQLRGPQHHFAYCDEIAQWNDAKLGTRRDTTWSNLTIGVRLPARPGWIAYRPRIVAATTPKQVGLLRSRDPNNPGLLEQDTVAITRGKTTDNLANLSENYRRQVIDPLLGTRLGSQELDGVMLEDVEGALWVSDQIDEDRVLYGDVPALAETVVAVDPSTTGGENSDEAGIVAVGRGIDSHGYVLGDATVKGSPLVWAVAAWKLAFDVEAEALVVEDNQGGQMCEVTLMAAWPTVAAQFAKAGRLRPAIRLIHAIASKRARAVPVALLYERHQIHHMLASETGANNLLLLEGELTGWDGTGDSPNRLDSAVHAIRWLYRIGVKQERVVVPQRWSGGRR